MIVVGPLPPPVHGASEITRRFAEFVAAEGLTVLSCNTSPRSGSRGLGYHLSRVRGYLSCYRAILTQPAEQHDTVYLSLAGGLGLIYDLVAVALARIRGLRLIFHHHSFAYLDNRNPFMSAIVRLAGSRQVHIALCPTMDFQLHAIYGEWLATIVISNLAFLKPAKPAAEPLAKSPAKSSAKPPANSFGVLGYLSNISFDKGIDRYLDLIAALRVKGSVIRGRIAGPYDNPGVEAYVEQRIGELGAIDYIGPVYGADKMRFFASIDLLVFPTRYVNEAEPLVIYEALSAGVPAVASARGCIPSMGGPNSLFLLDSDASNLEPVIDQILEWEKNPAAYRKVLGGLTGEFSSALEQHNAGVARLRAFLSGEPRPTAQ